MIPFDPLPEPADFDQLARQPGQVWLQANPSAERPRDYWTPFRFVLRAGFRNMCGYCAMRIPVGGGEVDHYVGYKEDPSKSYEWSNYRYSLGWLNKKKLHRRPNQLQVLDPFEIGEDWFEVLLPSMQLVLTENVPEHLRDRAKHTLKRLGLRDHEVILKERREWLELYETGELNLEGLRKCAPLIAKAVEKAQSQNL